MVHVAPHANNLETPPLNGLTATLMVVMNGMIMTHSASTKEVQKLTAFPSQMHLSHQSFIHAKYNYYQYSATENTKTSKFIKRKLMDNLILKLKKVIDRYEQKRGDLKMLYSEIAFCGLNKCGELPGLFPENKNFQNFKCSKFKKVKRLEKYIFLLLTNFSEGVQNSVKRFQKLIRSDKQDGNENRLRVLKELKNNMKTLKYEIKDAKNSMMSERLNSTRQQRKLTQHHLPNFQAPTDLMINEWRLIQQSEAFLKRRLQNLPKVFKCWKHLSK